jgi:hypothetical protein
MGDIEKQVSVDCKVIGVIEKWKDNRCFENSPKINKKNSEYKN